MYFDKSSAALISKEIFENKNNGEKIQALNYDLHVGTFKGPLQRLASLRSSL
jgi:hypothetical protein